jgi:hypothetical protein
MIELKIALLSLVIGFSTFLTGFFSSEQPYILRAEWRMYRLIVGAVLMVFGGGLLLKIFL